MKFTLHAKVTVSTYTEVEADSAEEALRIAGERDAVIGGIGSGAYPDESWIVDDIDGTPEEITIGD